MRGTTRTTTMAVAVAAGALVFGGSAVALAAGQGQGNGPGAMNGAGSTGQQADRENCDGAGSHGQEQSVNEQSRKGQAGRGQTGKGRVAAGQRGQAGQGGQVGHSDAATANLDLGVLTVEQEAEMAFMAEEEKMAGDLYEAFYDMYGVRVFTNIAASEDRHQAAVGELLDAYGLNDPTDGSAVGEFTLPEVQDLYDELLAQGSESVEAAFEVGVLVEETDIADLAHAIDDLDAPRAAAVYESLLAGSQNHLKAFSR